MNTIHKVNTIVQGAKHLAEGVAHTVEDVAQQAGDRVSHLSTGAKLAITGGAAAATTLLTQVPGLSEGAQQAAQTCSNFWNSPIAGALGLVAVLGGVPLLWCIGGRIAHGVK